MSSIISTATRYVSYLISPRAVGGWSVSFLLQCYWPFKVIQGRWFW